MKMQTPATPADTAPDPADIAIARAEARQRHRRRWLVVGGIASLLIGYPLSLGPLVFLGNSNLLPNVLSPILRVWKAPLDWADDQSDIVRDFYDWYLPFFDSSR